MHDSIEIVEGFSLVWVVSIMDLIRDDVLRCGSREQVKIWGSWVAYWNWNVQKWERRLGDVSFVFPRSSDWDLGANTSRRIKIIISDTNPPPRTHWPLVQVPFRRRVLRLTMAVLSRLILSVIGFLKTVNLAAWSLLAQRSRPTSCVIFSDRTHIGRRLEPTLSNPFAFL